MRAALSLGAIVALTFVTIDAEAHPRPLPFTYTSETLGEGELEIEQYADVVPVRALNAETGGRATALLSQLQTEIEYGLRDRLELGLYFTFAPSPSDEFTNAPRLTEGTGIKQRLRYQFAAPGEWPVDLGLYGEVVENDREVELEAKILLQRRIGRMRIAANIWGEYELYYAPHKDLVFNPTLGATYEITPSVHVGVESWSRTEWPSPAPHPRPFDLGPHIYVGPTVLFQLGKLWWANGIYGRVTDPDHSNDVGEAFGPVWFRTIVGFEL
jgi:hypothetical protein